MPPSPSGRIRSPARHGAHLEVGGERRRVERPVGDRERPELARELPAAERDLARHRQARGPPSPTAPPRRAPRRRSPHALAAPATRPRRAPPATVARPYSTVTRTPPGRSTCPVPPRAASARIVVHVLRDRRRVGDPLHGEPRERGRERREVGVGIDQRVEHRGLVAQLLERARDVGLRRRVQREHLADAPARADSALLASSRHGSPRASQYAAVSARVSPSSGRITRPDRAGIPSSARRPGEATSR